MQPQDIRLHSKLGLAAVSRKKAAESFGEEPADENGAVVKKKTTRKRAGRPARKKAVSDITEDPELVGASDATSDESIISALSNDSKKTQQRTRKKGISHTWRLVPFQMLYSMTFIPDGN